MYVWFGLVRLIIVMSLFYIDLGAMKPLDPTLFGGSAPAGNSPLFVTKAAADLVGSFRLPPRDRVVKKYKMILLIGTSSAGKSTLADRLFSELTKGDSQYYWKYVPVDGIPNKDMRKYSDEREKRSRRASDIESIADETYAFARYIRISALPDLNKQRRGFSGNVSPKESAILCDTVFDSARDLEWFKAQFPEFAITVVLVYAPLIDLPDRVSRRNSTGESLEIRDLTQATRIFGEIYTINFEERACNSAPVGEIFPSDPAFVCMSPAMAASFSHHDIRGEFSPGRLRKGNPVRKLCDREAFGIEHSLRLRGLSKGEQRKDVRTPLYSRLCHDVAVNTAQERVEDSIEKILQAVFPQK